MTSSEKTKAKINKLINNWIEQKVKEAKKLWEQKHFKKIKGWKKDMIAKEAQISLLEKAITEYNFGHLYDIDTKFLNWLEQELKRLEK